VICLTSISPLLVWISECRVRAKPGTC